MKINCNWLLKLSSNLRMRKFVTFILQFLNRILYQDKLTNFMYLIYVFGLYIFVGACHSNEISNLKFKTITFSETPPEIKLPSAIWDLLEDKKVIDSKGNIIQNKSYSTKIKENVFVGITVWLQEKTPGILGGENIEIKAIKSGMNLDLSRYIKLDKGTFFIRVSDEKGVRDLTQLTITDPSHPELLCDGSSEIDEKE